jgi:hypothetical protein
VFVSCGKTPTDPKAELMGALKDANLDGFYFETSGNDEMDVVSMTNGIVEEPIKMDSDATVVLRYATVKDKKANTSTTYKFEAIRAGDQLTIQATDIATGASLMKDVKDFPPPPPLTGDTCSPAFNSISDCICSQRAALQFEANRTCEPQSGSALCCINGNQLISVHLLVMPTNFRCSLINTNFDDLVILRD